MEIYGLERFIGAGVKIGRRAWHRLHLGEITCFGTCLTHCSAISLLHCEDGLNPTTTTRTAHITQF